MKSVVVIYQKCVVQIYDLLKRFLYVDWKAYILALFGFLCGVVSNSFSEFYNVWIGLVVFLGGWWLILSSIVIASRKADFSLGKLVGII